ncbi:MAG: sulfatase family protein [Chloroflexota bacterium]
MRPNILFLMADQQKATSLPQYGNPDTRSPHLDALASRGVTLTHAYVQHPFCVPSRAAFLTGRYPQAMGVHHNSHRVPAREVFLPELLRDAGYRTGAIGHLHGRDNLGRGCDYVYDMGEGELGARGREERALVQQAPRRVAHMVATTPRSPDEERDGLMTTAALAFIEEAARDPNRPFYLHVAWIAPHPPYFVSAPYAEWYDPAHLHLPPPEPADGNKPPIYRQTARDMGTLDAPEAELRAALAYYYGMCAYLDDQVGRLLDGLRRHGLDRNTLVVYTSDHGDYAGEHHMFGKSCTLYDCLTRVPLFVAGPDDLVPQGRRVGGLVESVDLAPTLLELAGVPLPARLNLHGDSLCRLWDAPGAGDGEGGEGAGYAVDGFDVAFSEVGAHAPETVRDPVRGGNVPNGPPASGRQVELSAMIRTPEWKYVHTPGREIQELYHLPSDRWELHNRFGRVEHTEVVASLRERLLDWRLGHT